MRNSRRTKAATPGGEVTGLGARQAALRLLDAVLRRGEPMDQASHAACQRLPSDDRALAIAIAGDALRWLSALDDLIDTATEQTLPDDSKVRMVLRVALVQLLKLNIAPHAVVATSLALLVGGPRRLTHAILSRAQREQWSLPTIPALPDPVARRWEHNWGKAVVEAAAAGWCDPPPLDLRFATTADAEAYAMGDVTGPRTRRLPRTGRVEALDQYDQGHWWVQDLAAGIAADLFGPGNGRAALDLCAAPGGKTMQLAAVGWDVTAVDISARRLERLSANLTRTGLSAKLVAADIMAYQPQRQFDAVLLDAPCSATGTYRRHPDVLYRIGDKEIADLTALQSRLLGRAVQWVAPDGQLVYATCSLEAEEGEAVISRFLADHADWQLVQPDPAQLPNGARVSANGMVRTLPGAGPDGGMDGFFVALLQRR